MLLKNTRIRKKETNLKLKAMQNTKKTGRERGGGLQLQKGKTGKWGKKKVEGASQKNGKQKTMSGG